jgi:hypothetical protein
MAFHPCTGGLCGGATMVAAALIGYDDMEETIVNDYLLYTDA